MEAAFDVQNPNGTGRRKPGDRVVHIYRLYRKVPPGGSSLGDLAGDGGILDTVRQGIRRVRQIIRDSTLAPLQGTGIGDQLQGRVLEREVQVVLVLDAFDEIPEVRSSFTYVSDGIPGENFFIDVPFANAKGVTHFRLAYRTFWTPILVNGVPVDGDAALLELQKLFDDYLYPPDGGSCADHELYWVDLNAPVSAQDPFGESEWLIHPLRHRPRVRMALPRTFTRFVAVEFLGLRSNRDLARAEDGLLGSLFGSSALAQLLNVLGLGELAGFITDVFGVADEFVGLLEDLNSLVILATDWINGVNELIEFSFAKARAILVAVQELIGRVESAIEDVQNIPNLVENQVRLLRQNVPGLVDDPTSGYLLTGSLRRTRDFLLAVTADPSRFRPALASAPVLPRTLAVQVAADTSIERIAQSANVSVATLIEANGLQYPFVDGRERPTQKLARLQAEQTDYVQRDQARADAGLPPLYTVQRAQLDAAIAAATTELTTAPALPNVLYAGDVIRIPQERPERLPSVVGIDGSRLNLIAAATGEPVTEEERIFGIDFYLSPEGNLEWDPDRRDLRLDRGLEHIRNVQLRYMRLPLGALRFAPAIGNFAFADLGRWQTAADNRLLAYAAYRTLVQDPRVRTVRRVRAESHRGVASLVYDAELINGQELLELRTPVGGPVG